MTATLIGEAIVVIVTAILYLALFPRLLRRVNPKLSRRSAIIQTLAGFIVALAVAVGAYMGA